jgi:DNA-binding Lrp family transcriptional regulator
MRVTDKEKNILACLQHDANLTIPDVAKMLRVKEHAVRYALGRLIDGGIILGKIPFIDMYRLGYVDYTFGISLAPAKSLAHERFVSQLVASRSVSWVAATTGSSQLAFSFLGKHPSEVHKFLDQICNKSTVHLLHQGLTVRLGFTALGRRFLSSNRKIKIKTFSYGDEPSSVTIDEIDHKILSGLSNFSHSSDRKLAKSLVIPLTTFERRVRRLEEVGVIRGYICRYNFSELNQSGYKVRIVVRGDRQAAVSIVKRIAERESCVVNYSIGLGAWDFEFTVEFSEKRELFPFTKLVTEQLGDLLASISTLQIFENIKYSGYPF